MRKILSGSYLIWALFSCPVFGSEITYSSVNPFDGSRIEGEVLLLKGEIVPGDYQRLLKIIGANPDRFWQSKGIVLASPGGDIQEALIIARFVKGTYTPVFVGKATGPCVSACFSIFASAARREAGTGMIGIHRPYVHPLRMSSMTPRQAEALQKELLQQARSHLAGLLVPTNIIDAMFQRASTEVYWLSRIEIEEQLGRRPPWYEQFLIARCGLDKSLEKRYFKGHDQALLDRLLVVDKCGNILSQPDAEAFLKTELKKSAKP